MEITQFLGDYYEELFLGYVNKRYRSMTTGEVKKRMEKLCLSTLEEVEKSNELNDIHAMLAKVCASLRRAEGGYRGVYGTGAWFLPRSGHMGSEISAGYDRRGAGTDFKDAGNSALSPDKLPEEIVPAFLYSQSDSERNFGIYGKAA